MKKEPVLRGNDMPYGIMLGLLSDEQFGKWAAGRALIVRNTLKKAQFLTTVTTAPPKPNQGNAEKNYQSVSIVEFRRMLDAGQLLVPLVLDITDTDTPWFGVYKSEVERCLITEPHIGVLIIKPGIIEPLQEYILELIGRKQRLSKRLKLAIILPKNTGTRMEHLVRWLKRERTPAIQKAIDACQPCMEGTYLPFHPVTHNQQPGEMAYSIENLLPSSWIG